MLIFILQTLAEILAGGTSLTSTEQIDFSHPANRRDEVTGPMLNLYVYDIRESKQVQHSGRQVTRKKTGVLQPGSVNWSPNWFDISLLLTAWDRTALGEQHLLTEVLTLLLRHRALREEFLLPELRDYGNLAMTVGLDPAIEIGSLWSALSVPLRPAVYLSISIPLESDAVAVPLVWERIMTLRDRTNPTHNGVTIARRVAIGGIVRSSVTNSPLADTKISIVGREKSTTSNAEGLFYFEDLSLGNYVLHLNCPDYMPQNVNALVDDRAHTFKEISLTPTA
jgi:Pvc16 N-terminal domain/Carboxypeptidase regulatory-like domain